MEEQSIPANVRQKNTHTQQWFVHLSVDVLDEAVPVVLRLGGVQGDFQKAPPTRHRHLAGQKQKTKNTSKAKKGPGKLNIKASG